MNWNNNRYANDPDFVDLGEFNINRLGKTCHYDLYALVGNKEISFGAKYGENDEDYESGKAYLLSNGQWSIWGGQATLLAAARYFANKYQQKEELGYEKS
jgi:hypothetical protein